MKNVLDYILNAPPRVLCLLGIDLDAFQCLTVQVEKLKVHRSIRLYVGDSDLVM
jgi:hypothetical protein